MQVGRERSQLLPGSRLDLQPAPGFLTTHSRCRRPSSGCCGVGDTCCGPLIPAGNELDPCLSTVGRGRHHHSPTKPCTLNTTIGQAAAVVADPPNCTPQANDLWSWSQKGLELLATTLAVSLGAPFCFDLLRRVANLRNSGPAPKEERSEASSVPRREDRSSKILGSSDHTLAHDLDVPTTGNQAFGEVHHVQQPAQ